MAAGDRDGHDVATSSRPAAAEYFLVSEFAPDAEAGWSLQCRRAGRTVWTAPLAPRGAAPRVRPAVAQAVAVRVLTEHGVFVSGWNEVTDDGRQVGRRFLARRPLGADPLLV